MFKPTRLTLPLLLALALALPACDINEPDFDLILDVEDVPVELDGTEGTVSVRANQATASERAVTNDLEVDVVEELNRIELRPDYFTFIPSAAAAKGAGVLGSGTIRMTIFFNGVPLPQVIVVTVADNVVTDVQPRVVTFLGVTIDKAAILAILGALPPGQRPTLKAWENMTLDQVVAEINAGLAQSTFPFAMAIQTTGDLNGTLKLNEFTVDARIRELSEDL